MPDNSGDRSPLSVARPSNAIQNPVLASNEISSLQLQIIFRFNVMPDLNRKLTKEKGMPCTLHTIAINTCIISWDVSQTKLKT